MADADFTVYGSNPAARTQADINRLAVHERFRWLSDEAQKIPLAAFVEQVKDITGGIALALEIVEVSEIRRQEAFGADADEILVPAIHLSDACILRRFAIAASRMLAEHSENLCDSLNLQATGTT
jgi:hypothetical protein